ncbi:MAG: hypothetical protein QNJ60_06100 [Xenococcaceae cyanobacterium MO_188.B19]|nr:hypothetical protein [Xenococcaceae cyanobacterium MO_188.B19]
MGTKQYLIAEIEICNTCEGKGIVYADIWKEFTDFSNQIDKSLSRKEQEKEQENWWNERGYSGWSGNCSSFNLPPEEEGCWNCEGEGKITRQVDLETVLKEILPKLQKS